MVNTVGTRIIEAVIDGLSRGNIMGGMMIGLNPVWVFFCYIKEQVKDQLGCKHGLGRGS